MHADELRLAIDRVVDTLTASGILTAIRDYRTSKGDQRPVAAARLGHAGAMLMERMERVTPHEKTALQLLHLTDLREQAYWQDLLSPKKPEAARSAELVQLYSRVLFASNHLPNFAALLGRVTKSPVGTPTAAGTPQTAELRAGESRFTFQLSDAGEKASDPDRIARSIDGIDMLYSASASLSRRPAMDLRLDYVGGGNGDRSIAFTGESDSVSAMSAVIDSIPDALADLNDDQEIDLDSLVSSLPIFEQLGTLAGHGAFSENDLRDIRETMHQGALLTLESGVILPEAPQRGANVSQGTRQQAYASASSANGAATNGAHAPSSVQQSAPAPSATAAPTAARSAPERDEHYERYLQERAAMQNGSGGNGVIQPAADDPFPRLGNAVEVGTPPNSAVDAEKQSAVEDLLKTLNRQRDR